jgi:hypothetical protein
MIGEGVLSSSCHYSWCEWGYQNRISHSQRFMQMSRQNHVSSTFAPIERGAGSLVATMPARGIRTAKDTASRGVTTRLSGNGRFTQIVARQSHIGGKVTLTDRAQSHRYTFCVLYHSHKGYNIPEKGLCGFRLPQLLVSCESIYRERIYQHTSVAWAKNWNLKID